MGACQPVCPEHGMGHGSCFAGEAVTVGLQCVRCIPFAFVAANVMMTSHLGILTAGGNTVVDGQQSPAIVVADIPWEVE